MKTERKPKPCPFCGEKPALIMGNDKLTKIVCPPESSCADTGLFICFLTDDFDKAITAWNSRQ